MNSQNYKVSNSTWINFDMLKAVVQCSPLSIIVVGLNGKVLLLNECAEQTFGWNEEDVIGKLYPVIPYDKKREVLRTFLEIKSNDTITCAETHLRKKDGVLINVNYSASPLRDRNDDLIGIVIIIEDISKRKKAEKELKDIKFALDQSSIVAITNHKGIITYANDIFCEISNYSKEELIGNDHRIINSGYHSKDFFEKMWKTIQSGLVWKGEVRNKRRDGSIYWVDTTIVPFMDHQGKPYQYVSIRNDITERKRAEQELNFLVNHDELTGLPNRRVFKEQLETVLEEARECNEKVAVICLQINRFKSINDSLGNAYGDQVLKQVGQRLKSCISDEDMIAHYNGDEFFIYLKNTNEDAATTISQNLLLELDDIFYVQENDYFTTFAIGISMFPTDGELVEELASKADIAMYHSKKHGRNSYQFYVCDLKNKINREVEIEKNLRKALENEEFQIHYQPKISLTTGKMIGMEALLRWNSPEIGFVSPSEFIPIAEETGMIIPIGEWVLKTACIQNKCWQDAGYEPLRVSVNLSVIQFQDPLLVNVIKRTLKETNLDPKYLELEITENIAIQQKEYVSHKLQLIKDIGAHISIDDFGTGYSSLSYLRKYPIQTLKIDKSFIDDIVTTGDTSIVRAIIAMAQSLGLNVIAEGVEDEEQTAFLRDQKCNEVQGYFFSKPLPVAEFEQYLIEKTM